MPHNVSHFAVHADDLRRARRFYEAVFGWRFTPWGPPDFYMIQTGPDDDPGIHGSLQKRREPVQSKGMIGYECTITVDDVDRTAADVTANGGKLVFPKSLIPTVGWLIQFLDTEGNVVCAMQYDEHAQ
jgi:predicted enzyme related to lactoylglutathione lyase